MLKSRFVRGPSPFDAPRPGVWFLRGLGVSELLVRVSEAPRQPVRLDSVVCLAPSCLCDAHPRTYRVSRADFQRCVVESTVSVVFEASKYGPHEGPNEFEHNSLGTGALTTGVIPPFQTKIIVISGKPAGPPLLDGGRWRTLGGEGGLGLIWYEYRDEGRGLEKRGEGGREGGAI